jgi:autotransporter-associated beta strand protein
MMAGTVCSQVVINEIVAANSDRLLQYSTRYPSLGTTIPWYVSGFDDSHWNTGKGPFGFGTFAGVTLGVNTSAAMQNKVASLYVRRAFDVTADQAVSTNELQLVTRFNDGFIAFVNGVEVARRNMGNPGMFAYRDQTAFNTNVPSAAAITIGLGMASNRLWTGTNVLCIQTHNKTLTSGDFLSMADLRIGGSAQVSLVTNSAVWKYFAGVSEPSGGLIDYGLINGLPQIVTWAKLEYNDSSWPESKGPFGYDRNTSVHYLLGTNLSSRMYGIAASLYTRTLFSATTAEAASSDPLQLVIDYDDGIIVYLNGVEVARRNVGTANTVTPYNTLATASHGANGEGGTTGKEEVITLGAANTLLSGGDNVLSLQIHNNSLTSSDLIGNVTLSTTGTGARTLANPTDTGRYFVGTCEPQEAGTGDDEDDSIDIEEDTPDSESDWIELYNAGGESVNLTGWSLTDDDGKPRKWYFPAGSSIAAGGYLIVMATGFDVGPATGATYLHTNFKLSSGGEYLGLVNASGTTVSELAPAFPAQSHFHSYVRTGEGLYKFSDTATPGAANAGTLFAAITAPPDFSQPGGFYTSGFTLQLVAPDAGAAIRYTLDGSEPLATNALYSAPLSINANATVRARCFKAGEVPSAVRTYNYLIGQSVARRSIPALCLTSEPVLSLYGPNASGGPTNGIGIMAIKGGGYISQLWDNLGDMSAFNMPLLYGRCAERPAAFEYYPTNGVSLRTDLGLRISSSGYSRPRLVLSDQPGNRFTPTDPTKKPSFNIFFRGELGDSPADYAFFPESRVTKFENMRLRAGKNDISNPFIADELMRRLFIGTGQQGAIGSFVSLYINGVWKGYFNFCEHLREAFMQQHYNSIATWDVQQVNAFASGDNLHWKNTLAVLRTNDLSKVSNYVLALNYIDTENFADYLIVHTFAAQGDWPNNNWVAARERSTAGRWRFYMWDAEMSFGLSTGRATSFDSFTNDLLIADAKTTGNRYIPAIYTLLSASPEFKLRFADRVQKHLFNEGCMTKSNMQSLYLKLRDTINPIMKETVNATVNESFYNNWIVSDVRRSVYFTQLTQQGLWPSTLAPEFSQYGGTLAPNTAISITNVNASGTIYYTTNGTDPRAVGGAVSGMLYTASVRFPVTATLRARVLSSGGEWSPLQETSFIVPVNVPVFRPTGSADWTADANWSSSPLAYPCGTNAAVCINAPETADRDISLRSPVTVGSITVVQNDTSFRNKIRDRSTGNTLTFQTTNGPAALVVNGTGTGYVEFEVSADTLLASDLRVEVNNTVGSSDYGALRLRANWRGSGGVVKEGDGIVTLTGDGKSYTGATVVNQGVLAITESASPSQSSSVSVSPGGQVRLTSAGTVGSARVYVFGGPLQLDSMGRGGTLPSSGQGVSGGLRYQPESNDSYAILTNPVAFAGLSAIHVENIRNTLELSGPLSGSSGFVKTGSGNLVLSAQSKPYLAPVTVSNGTLTVNGRVLSAINVAPDGALAGAGRTGALLGEGTVSVDGTILTAPTATGLNYGFSVSKTGSPLYASPHSCGNGVLRLFSIKASDVSSVIDVYLDVSSLSEGDCFRGGIFVEGGHGLAEVVRAATVRFFVPDAGGGQKFAGRTYSAYSGCLRLSLTAMPEEADFGDGPRSGEVLEVRVAGSAVRYSEWASLYYYYASDVSELLLTAPLADPFQAGMVNLMRYALGYTGVDALSGRMPHLEVESNRTVYSFQYDPGKIDLVYRVEASSNLCDWSRVLFDSSTRDLSAWDGESVTLYDEVSDPAVMPRQFYRLRVFLTYP